MKYRNICIYVYIWIFNYRILICQISAVLTQTRSINFHLFSPTALFCYIAILFWNSLFDQEFSGRYHLNILKWDYNRIKSNKKVIALCCKMKGPAHMVVSPLCHCLSLSSSLYLYVQCMTFYVELCLCRFGVRRCDAMRWTWCFVGIRCHLHIRRDRQTVAGK